MNECTDCGSPVDEADQYCAACGTPLDPGTGTHWRARCQLGVVPIEVIG